jgi:hypothetical protein
MSGRERRLTSFRHGDDLHAAGRAARLHRPVDDGPVLGDELAPDVLDHLDADEAVERAAPLGLGAALAVVHQVHGDAVREAGVGDAPAGERRLVDGERDGVDGAVDGLGEEDGERRPAGAWMRGGSVS